MGHAPCGQRTYAQVAGRTGANLGPLRATGVRRYFRADAAFAKPDIYEFEERQVLYAIRLPGNVLQREIAPLLKAGGQAAEASSRIRYDDFWYQAGSWNRARRVVAKVEWRELFPRVGFIVTNMSAGPEGVAFLQWSWDSRAVD